MIDSIDTSQLARHDIPDTVPESKIRFNEAQRKQAELNNVDTNFSHIVMPRAKSNPYDLVDKIADLLVDPRSKQLRAEYLTCTLDEFRATVVKVYGDTYDITEAFFTKQRKITGDLNGKVPHTIPKLVTALEKRGVNVPVIDDKKMSFNQVRRHLIGKGKAQEFNVSKMPYITLGRRFVVMGGKQWGWVNTIGIACEVNAAVGLEPIGRAGRSFLMFAEFEGLLGMDRKEIERRCSLSPH